MTTTTTTMQTIKTTMETRRIEACRPSRGSRLARCVGAPLAALLLLAACGVAHAQTKAPAVAPAASAPAVLDAHRREDVARHRAISAAHDAAARCLESGEKESTCQTALRKACEGIAVGRYCGMKHSH